jgi:hypothetical protein
MGLGLSRSFLDERGLLATLLVTALDDFFFRRARSCVFLAEVSVSASGAECIQQGSEDAVQFLV